DLRRRSYQKELMDAEHIPFADIAQTLKALNIINTRLGGHSITVDGVRQLMAGDQPLVVCEIGCGGGDTLVGIRKFCKKKNIPVRFIGIDMNPECIAFAKQQYPELDCEWIASDYALVDLQNRKP